MKRADITSKMSEITLRLVAIDRQLEGQRQMFEAAVLINNPSQQIRDNLHTLLDEKLDAIAGLYLLSRQLSSAKD